MRTIWLNTACLYQIWILFINQFVSNRKRHLVSRKSFGTSEKDHLPLHAVTSNYIETWWHLRGCCCNIRKQQLIFSKGLSSLKNGVEQIGGEVFVTEKEEGYSIASSVCHCKNHPGRSFGILLLTPWHLKQLLSIHTYVQCQDHMYGHSVNAVSCLYSNSSHKDLFPYYACSQCSS